MMRTQGVDEARVQSYIDENMNGVINEGPGEEEDGEDDEDEL